jgi:hypothetical protein
MGSITPHTHYTLPSYLILVAVVITVIAIKVGAEGMLALL